MATRSQRSGAGDERSLRLAGSQEDFRKGAKYPALGLVPGLMEVPVTRSQGVDEWMSEEEMVEVMGAGSALVDQVELDVRERERSVRAVGGWETAVPQRGRALPVVGDEMVLGERRVCDERP